MHSVRSGQSLQKDTHSVSTNSFFLVAEMIDAYFRSYKNVYRRKYIMIFINLHTEIITVNFGRFSLNICIL